MQGIFNSECHKLTRESQCVVIRYNVCQLVCKVDSRAMSANNIFVLENWYKPYRQQVSYLQCSYNTKKDKINTEEDNNYMYNETKDRWSTPTHSQVKTPHK